MKSSPPQWPMWLQGVKCSNRKHPEHPQNPATWSFKKIFQEISRVLESHKDPIFATAQPNRLLKKWKDARPKRSKKLPQDVHGEVNSLVQGGLGLSDEGVDVRHEGKVLGKKHRFLGKIKKNIRNGRPCFLMEDVCICCPFFGQKTLNFRNQRLRHKSPSSRNPWRMISGALALPDSASDVFLGVGEGHTVMVHECHLSKGWCFDQAMDSWCPKQKS